MHITVSLMLFRVRPNELGGILVKQKRNIKFSIDCVLILAIDLKYMISFLEKCPHKQMLQILQWQHVLSYPEGDWLFVRKEQISLPFEQLTTSYKRFLWWNKSQLVEGEFSSYKHNHIEGIPLDSVWESLLLFRCPLALGRRPRLGRKRIFKMDKHKAVHYETS